MQTSIRRLIKFLSFSLVLWSGVSTSVRAQERAEFWPEVDAHLKLNSRFRVYFQAKAERDEGNPLQAELGPSLQLYLKPSIKLKQVAAFDLDDAKPRFFVLETGYRYVTAPDTPPTNRMLAVATLNYPMGAGFHLSDRNRADLNWKSGVFTWRYRNKLTIERTFAIHSYHLIPYVAAEPYYVSQYHKWSTTALYAGCLLPVGRHVEFNPYFENENNTGKHPNDPNQVAGLALYLFFSMAKK
jgi:hypothetical protein